jgi:hypothetical protein
MPSQVLGWLFFELMLVMNTQTAGGKGLPPYSLPLMYCKGAELLVANPTNAPFRSIPCAGIDSIPMILWMMKNGMYSV